MSETPKIRKTHPVRVCDLIDSVLMCFELKNQTMAEFMVLLMPKIGQKDIDEYYDEMVFVEKTKDDMDEHMFMLIELLEKDGKWNYDD